MAPDAGHAPLTDNSFQPLSGLAELRALPALRVTQIAKLIECPRGWKAQMLGEGPSSDSAAGRIGTAVHLVIERFLRREFDLFGEGWHQQQIHLEGEGVPVKERVALARYLEELQRYRECVLCLEREFILPLSQAPAVPEVKGHIDAVFNPMGGPLIIRDHKTNRNFKGVEWWRQQWQPRLYGWAAKTLWPMAYPIVFQIGYVNLGEVVQWKVDTMDWFDLEHRYSRAWAEVIHSCDNDRWRESLNGNCGFCPVRLECATSRAATFALLGAIGQRLFMEEED